MRFIKFTKEFFNWTVFYTKDYFQNLLMAVKTCWRTAKQPEEVLKISLSHRMIEMATETKRTGTEVLDTIPSHYSKIEEVVFDKKELEKAIKQTGTYHDRTPLLSIKTEE